MPGAGAHDPAFPRPAAPGWSGLAWKVLLALFILLLLSAGIPISSALVFTSVRLTLLAWGGLVVAVAAYNLFADLGALRWAWIALTVGAYAALVAPGPAYALDTLGPVAALTLAAHLGRKDLPRALRDWAVVIGVSLYTALGILAMPLILSSYGLELFLSVILLPALFCEGALVLLRRMGNVRATGRGGIAAVLAATVATLVVITFTLLGNSDPNRPFFVLALFYIVAGFVIGGSLLLSLWTRPLVEAAAGPGENGGRASGVARALLELSYAPLMISIVLYSLSRLLNIAV